MGGRAANALIAGNNCSSVLALDRPKDCPSLLAEYPSQI